MVLIFLNDGQVMRRPPEPAPPSPNLHTSGNCPRILQSDNGCEFASAVIQELTSLWPAGNIVNGRPRHPANKVFFTKKNVQSLFM
ncbi:hypothetical protein TNCV_1072661 [Trichonephila clavipes]|nr:hypothetical protein TNCV_1072661 [Trichonephila clavipes]